MYSLVLMAALTSSAAEPGCWCRGGCGYGGGYGGCYGGYGGCYGGYGGCYGGGYGGCYGGGGGWGAYPSYGVGYGYACYGGGYGGCVGGGWGITNYAPAVPPQIYSTPPATAPAPGTVPPAAESVPAPRKTSMTNRARLIVEVPDDAKLYIDDRLMTTTSGERTFRTPQLERGQAYYYILRAEVVRDGKPLAFTKQVIVRAGDEARTAFTELQVAADRVASAGQK